MVAGWGFAAAMIVSPSFAEIPNELLTAQKEFNFSGPVKASFIFERLQSTFGIQVDNLTGFDDTVVFSSPGRVNLGQAISNGLKTDAFKNSELSLNEGFSATLGCP